MELSDLTASIAGILMAVCQLPQLIKVVKTRNVDGISLWMQVLLGLGMFFWLVTGILLESVPMYISNGCCLVFCLTIIFYIIKEGKGKKQN